MNLQRIKALQYTWLLPRLFSKSGLRRAIGLPIGDFIVYADCVTNLDGLEIGGPSAVFRSDGFLPVYDLVGSLDNCNFTSNTVWQRDLRAGRTFHFSRTKPPGTQYILDAAELPEALNGHYDFLLSSHMLEHTANPVRALRAWHRVLRPSGALILLLPDKNWTFDHRRPVTTIEHLIHDFETETQEDDRTHMEEILELHDLSRNAPVTRADLERQARHNFEIRTLHHHVFDTGLVRQMLEYSGFAVQKLSEEFPYHLVALATALTPPPTPAHHYHSPALTRP